MKDDELLDLYDRAIAGFGVRVHAVGADQWHLTTPCADWDVRQLVNHVTGENAWVVPLLDGRTIGDVGNALDGDLLGDEPRQVWDERAAAARAAVSMEGALGGTVHVSFGDIPGSEYVSQIITDHIVHAWDLARAIGADEGLDPDLVLFALRFLEPQAEQWRAAGAFGPKVELAGDADVQARLLAIAGRREG